MQKTPIFQLIKKQIEFDYKLSENGDFIFNKIDYLEPVIRHHSDDNYYFVLYNTYTLMDSRCRTDGQLINVRCSDLQNIKIVNSFLKSLYDGSFVEKYYCNIFVYGTLKRGYRNSSLCSDSIRNIPCAVKGTMYDSHMGYPILTLTGDYVIHGELITIPKSQLYNFDMLQGYPNYYDRQVVSISVQDKTYKAYVYTMNNVDQFLSKKSIVQSGVW